MQNSKVSATDGINGRDIVEGDIGKIRILGVEDQGAIALSQAFDRQIAMQDGDDDIAGLGRDGAVDNEKVAVVYSGIAHGFALRADEKGRGRAADQMQIEIEVALDMVVGGAWKTGGYPGAVERQGEFGGLIGETLQGGGPRCCLNRYSSSMENRTTYALTMAQSSLLVIYRSGLKRLGSSRYKSIPAVRGRTVTMNGSMERSDEKSSTPNGSRQLNKLRSSSISG